jgi:hypothetical protein
MGSLNSMQINNIDHSSLEYYWLISWICIIKAISMNSTSQDDCADRPSRNYVIIIHRGQYMQHISVQ